MYLRGEYREGVSRMKLMDVLPSYSVEQLERLAADKVGEVATLRLPPPVLVKEIASVLSSRTYVGKVLAPSRPPTYAMLKLMLDAPTGRVPAEGLRDRVMELTNQCTQLAADARTLPKGKSYDLYLRLLAAAWESDGGVDRSEAWLLSALRLELGIWTREHLLLEHHPTVRPLWDGPKAFEHARNHLLATGIVLIHEHEFVLAEEVGWQVRAIWEMEMDDPEYVRLLGHLPQRQIRQICELQALPVSGSKDELIARVVAGLVPPQRALDCLHIDEVKELCRTFGIPVSQPKGQLIAAITEHLDHGRDLVPEAPPVAVAPVEIAQEPRVMEEQRFQELLATLTSDQLYDILSRRGLRVGGAKSERIARLIASPWSEATLLGELPKSTLVEMCRASGLQVSGVKDDLIRRIVDRAGHPETEEKITEIGLGVIDLEGHPPASVAVAEDDIDEVEDEPTEQGTRPLDPPGMHGIRSDFPELSHGEMVVLAILEAARSLTEQELDRVVRRHHLGWFLVKAQMAELIARLAAQGKRPVRVRCSGGVNIYEWTGTHGTPAVDHASARDLIDALRQGVVPDRHLGELVIGQVAARAHLSGLLGHVAGGRSEFKFLRGPYGSGKTFMCSWLREQAFAQGFAVSTVRVGPDQPLSDLPVLFSGLCTGLRTPEQRDTSAVSDILESWLLGLYRKTAAQEQLSAADPSHRARISTLVGERIEHELAHLDRLDPSFAPAVRHFYLSRLQEDEATARTALAWLRGSGSLSADQLRRIGVRGQLQGEDVFPRMRALVSVIRGGHLRGLVLFIDELELVRRFPHARQRERAYETLRLLIDECGENGLPGTLIVCTGTDPLFEDERFGMPSYEALSNRIRLPSTSDSAISVRQPVIRLEALDGPRLEAMAARVRDLHGVAYGWDAPGRFDAGLLRRFVDDTMAFTSSGVGRVPRPVLRKLVHVLDLCEENPDVPVSQFVGSQVGQVDDRAIEDVLALG